MRCPWCGNAEDRVVDSRESRERSVIRRRRQCVRCARRFTSYETVEEVPLEVVKKDGTRETFDREKVLTGIRHACGTRIAEARIQEIAAAVQRRVSRSPERELSTPAIGELVMESLKREDHVSYVRFASVYRDFQDTEDFVTEIRSLLVRRAPGTTPDAAEGEPEEA